LPSRSGKRNFRREGFFFGGEKTGAPGSSQPPGNRLYKAVNSERLRRWRTKSFLLRSAHAGGRGAVMAITNLVIWPRSPNRGARGQRVEFPRAFEGVVEPPAGPGRACVPAAGLNLHYIRTAPTPVKRVIIDGGWPATILQARSPTRSGARSSTSWVPCGRGITIQRFVRTRGGRSSATACTTASRPR